MELTRKGTGFVRSSAKMPGGVDPYQSASPRRAPGPNGVPGKTHAEPEVEGTLSFLPGRQDILAFLLPCIPAVPPNGRQRRIRPGKGVAAAPNTFQEGLLPFRVGACLLCGRNSPGYISIGYLFSHCSSQSVLKKVQ